MDYLWLKDYSLEWFPIAVITTIIAYIIGAFIKQQPIVYQKE